MNTAYFNTYELTEEQIAINEAIAIERFNKGEKPTYSTGICDNITCGYGELDQLGYWEFPLYPDTTPEAFACFKENI